jgi:hypothetical protein
MRTGGESEVSGGGSLGRLGDARYSACELIPLRCRAGARCAVYWPVGTGLIIELAPGRSASVPVVYGTASTREDLGSALPPGTYWFKVQMRFRRGLGGLQLTRSPPAGADHDRPPSAAHRGCQPLNPLTRPHRVPVRGRPPARSDLNQTLRALPLVFGCPAVVERAGKADADTDN